MDDRISYVEKPVRIENKKEQALMNKTIVPTKLNHLITQFKHYKKMLLSATSTTSPATALTATQSAELKANNVTSSNGSHKQNVSNQHNNQYQQQPPQNTPTGQQQSIATPSQTLTSATYSHLSSHQQHQQTTSTLTTIVTSIASWWCSYHMFKCAYRIWTNSGLNGLSFVSYPIVSNSPQVASKLLHQVLYKIA